MSAAADPAPRCIPGGPFSAERRARLGVLISGRGSNMLSLADACAAPDFPAELALVLSNEPDAPGLAAAAARGIATAVVSHRDYPRDKAGFEAAIDAELAKARIDVLCLAGFMRVLSPFLVERWTDRLLNVHPSLLPLFRGLETHARALAAGVKLHGATVHLVRPALDDGPILAQAAITVAPEDTPDTLAARLLPVEHQLYRHALGAYLAGAAPGAAPAPYFAPPLRRS